MKYFKITAVFVTAVFLVKAPALYAQVEVVESSPTIRAAGQSQNPFAPKEEKKEQNIQAEMYYQLQALQQEVATLRGQLEEQSYELKRLKQQRLDDYTDLDDRVSTLSNGGAVSAPRSVNSRSSSNSGHTSSQGVTTRPASNPDEFASYNGAMDLIRSKQYDQAIESFQKLLADHPHGQYSANSLHWLGQLYQLRNDPEKARDSYSKVVSDYPEHSKSSDAKLKLGQLYFQLGDKQKSKALLQEVAASDTSESRLAKSFLQEKFPQ
ncbi:MAG: tetratricopeptide repeat protein [Cellvibrionaceae bacterium]